MSKFKKYLEMGGRPDFTKHARKEEMFRLDDDGERTLTKIIDQITNLQDISGPGTDILGEIVKRLGK